MKALIFTVALFLSAVVFGDDSNDICEEFSLTPEVIALSEAINNGSISIPDASTQLWELSRDTVMYMNLDNDKVGKLFEFRMAKVQLDYKDVLDADPVKQKAVNDYLNLLPLLENGLLSGSEMDSRECYAADHLDKVMGSKHFRFYGFYHLGDAKKDIYYQELSLNEESLNSECNCSSNSESH